MSAAKKKPVHLFETHAERLTIAAYNLAIDTSSALTKQERARVEGLSTEIEALVQLIRPLVPDAVLDTDMTYLATFTSRRGFGRLPGDGPWKTWTVYDKAFEGYKRYLARSSAHTPEALYRILEHVILPTTERLPFDERPWPPGVDALARVISDEALPAHERSDARAVLSDLLEERGYANVADVLRLDQPRVDLFVLPYLRGEFYVTPPKRRPR